MFSFDRRITLEEQGGNKCSAYLLEVIEGHFFVLCPTSITDALHRLDLERDWADVCELLAREVRVMDVRTHTFLADPEATEVVRFSQHEALQAVALLWDLGADVEGVWNQDACTPQAFAAECRRRTSLL